MMKVSASLQGGMDLERKLRALPEAVSFKVQRDGLLEGAEPIRAEAAHLAPRSERHAPHMADNIIVDALSAAEVDRSVDFNPGDVVVEVGPRREFFWGYFLEYGTSKMRAFPFMRPAFDLKASTALNVALSYFWNAIRKFASGPANVGSIGSRHL